MTRHPQISMPRLHAWTRRRSIPARSDGDWLYFTDEAAKECALRACLTKGDSLVVVATLPLTEEGHDLGLARATREEGNRVLALRSMTDGAPRHSFIEARYAKDPTKLDLVGVVDLEEGVTDTQLDQVIPDLVDAVGVSGAFHPLMVSLSPGVPSIHEGGAGSSLTRKWREAIAEQPVPAPESVEKAAESGEESPWWNADPEEETPPVTAERVLAMVRWLNADALVEQRTDSEVILLRSRDLTFELTIFPDGRMNISHRRELTEEEMNHPGLSECISTSMRDYLRLTIGVMSHPQGGTLRLQYTHHLLRMSDEQLDATIQRTFTLVRQFMDSLDTAFAASDTRKDGK